MSEAPQNSGGSRRSKPPRFNHRARSHEDAHAENAPAGSHGGHHAVAHPLVPPGAPEVVASGSALDTLIGRLRAAGTFAYDSEFIGELTYVPHLCLIQVAWPEHVALIDPLGGLDVTPFWELVCDPSVEKVVHAGQQDVEPVFRFMNRPPANLFDTQVAAGFVGLPYPLALSKLVQEFVGAKLGKGLTFTHWDQRPLSTQQLRYAADDVRYLPAARAELGLRLAQAGHAEWVRQESAELCVPGVYQFDPKTSYTRVRGSGNLAPQEMAVLRELTIWRDAGARTDDVPPRTFLKDEILLDLARKPVKSVDKLDRVRGLPRPVEAAHGPAIVAATLKALALPPGEMPENKHVEPTPREKFTCDALWAAAQTWCFGRAIDPNLVTSRQEIGELWRDRAAGGDGSSLHVMQGWRREALGQTLVEMLRGTKRLAIDWDDALRATVAGAGA